MFELFKGTSYKGYIEDTFKFIKLYGLHLIKNYLIINSLFIITTSVLTSSLGSNSILNFPISVMVLLFFLVLVFGIFNFAFIPVYFKLIAENSGTNFGLKEILKGIKNSIGKTIKYSLYMIMWSFPFIIAVAITAITIIGIPAIFLFLPFFMLWTIMSYHYYLAEENVSVFKILGPNFRLVKKQFWPALGTVMLFLFLSYVASNLITLLPGIIYYFTSVTTSEGHNSFFDALTYKPNFIVNVISASISLLFSLLYMISIGVIYYTLRNKEVSIDAEIEQLGQ